MENRELDLTFDPITDVDDDDMLTSGHHEAEDGQPDATDSGNMAAVTTTITEAQFRTLERQYQETLAELEAVSSLNRYREEFEKLFGSFRTSFTNEQQLVATAQAGQAKLDSTKEKLDTAHKRIDDQEVIINNYKRELQKALEEVHMAKSEKKEAEEKINALNGEIRRLTAAVDEATDRGNNIESRTFYIDLTVLVDTKRIIIRSYGP
jgi:chromosome segregation ATPase